MSSMITIDTEYYMCATSVVDLSPKSWDDVDQWYIKWDILNVKFKDKDGWHTYALESDTGDGVDWSKPIEAKIYKGDREYDITLDTKENF